MNPGNIQAYLDYFTLPGAGFANSSGNERYYEFRWGDVHFFALDSDGNEPDGVAADSAQAAWLQTAMAASTARWQIVFMHHPPYSSGGIYFDDPRVQWPYAQWGADVVLSGHNHIYERLVIDGLNYTVNGLGGRSSIYPLRNPRAGSQILFNADHGAQLFTADETGLTFEFYSVANLAQGGTRIDRVTLLAADFDGDNRIALSDLARIQQRFGQQVSTARDGDVDGDSRVTARDLALLTYSFGATALPVASPPAAIEASPRDAAPTRGDPLGSQPSSNP